ncbi:MFS transporter [Rhodanobacter sp. Root480]|uniref:AmpG family muropeptide MFS transporter n=1 Tax=unclassified Rhodanobacter TaxID=2621553 RepID=UPI0006F3B39E|nr:MULTISPECIES: MFS transporter [unclassified Rhodanobacter]KQX98058.1 MFS transporter [Rhodanobacter sp. Root480]KRA33829.1 MFS transporter [Rhodanobacter sp. Root627]
MTNSASRGSPGILASLKPYLEPAPIGALLLGMSSGFPYAMIGATLTTRLAQDGIDKRSVTAFSLAFLVYNLKFLWAPVVDRARLPLLGRYGQRRSWLWLTALAVAASVVFLGVVSPQASLETVALAAVLVGVAGATFDIVIDAYRIEILQPRQLGVGSGMSQYGWRIGSVSAGAIALLVAASSGWALAYTLCAFLVLPAVFVGFWLGEPARHRDPIPVKGLGVALSSAVGPLAEFFRRSGAWLVLLFVLIHKIGDTLANLTVRLLLQDLHFSNEEIATYDVGFGFVAYLIGIFIGGMLYVRLGMKRAVLLSLVLMAVSNLSFAVLAHMGHNNDMLAFTIGFENIASGIGGVVVVAYLSALCNLSYTASQYALLSAAASVVGRLVTGTTAGGLIQSMGYVDFYLMTTIVALPGVALFAWMMHRGLVDRAIAEVDVRASA